MKRWDHAKAPSFYFFVISFASLARRRQSYGATRGFA
jgi:hypothetical protein